jgi:hypothetical protein
MIGCLNGLDQEIYALGFAQIATIDKDCFILRQCVFFTDLFKGCIIFLRVV